MSTWELVFYETVAGNSPVTKFLDDLPTADAARAARELELMQAVGTQLGMPHVRHLEDTELWEIRIRGRRQHRILYVAMRGQQILLLHGFTKKTEKTPAREIRTAEARLADFRERQNQ